MNPSKKDPTRLVDHLAEIEVPSEYGRRVSAAEAEPVRIVWIRLLWAGRRFLLRAGVVGAALSLLVALLLPVSYQSQMRLMPPDQQQGGGSGLAVLAALATKSEGSAMTGGLSGGLGRMASDFLGLKTSGALVVDMLKGSAVQDRMIQQFDLRKTYHARYWQDARRALDAHTTVKEDRKSGVITIAVDDRDPHRAQQMAQAYEEVLNSLLAQVSTSSARRERMFLEQRLKTAKESLDTAAQQFSSFASKTGALDVPGQTKAMVESEAKLEGELVAAESELEGMEQIYTDNNVRVRSLRGRIAELKKQVENFSGNKADPASSDSQIAGDLPSLRKLPVVGVLWTNLYREAKIQETVYEMLTQEYELAKIQEAKELPTVNVLDPALLPERKSFPPRTIIAVVGTFLSVLFAGIFVIGASTWNQSEAPEKQLAKEIWEQMTAETGRSRSLLQQVWSKFGGRNGRY